jgi:hypothetical protein
VPPYPLTGTVSQAGAIIATFNLLMIFVHLRVTNAFHHTGPELIVGITAKKLYKNIIGSSDPYGLSNITGQKQDRDKL